VIAGMAHQNARCPRCHRTFPWGTTVCPACHIGLDLNWNEAREAPAALIFETGDRPSVDMVVSLLEAHGVTCVVRGAQDTIHFGIGPGNFWQVFVRTSDEKHAQEILDVEIGRGDEG
jgi:hypothetical protein